MLEIFFSDLNEEGQKKVMDHFNIKSPEEGNFDMDILPLAIIESPIEDQEDSW